MPIEVVNNNRNIAAFLSVCVTSRTKRAEKRGKTPLLKAKDKKKGKKEAISGAKGDVRKRGEEEKDLTTAWIRTRVSTLLN